MRRRQWLRVALGAGAAIGTAAVGAAGAGTEDTTLRTPAPVWRSRSLIGFGTTLHLQVGDADPARAQAGLDLAIAAVREVEHAMSLFDPDSALSRLNRTGRLDAPPLPLRRVLERALAIARGSEGAFDPTVQPLWDVWWSAHRDGRRPDDAALAAARARVDWRAVRIADASIALSRPGMAITLNGIAQGYAADLARERLADLGIRHALLDTGEWSMLGAARDGGPWTLGLADPAVPARLLSTLVTDGRAVAVSDDAHTRFSADRRDHHILDPRTGRSPPEVALVAVLAPDCTTADALTKVAFIAGPGGLDTIARRWGVDVAMVDKAGRLHATRGVRLT